MAFVRTSDGIRIRYDVVGRREAEPLLMIQGLGTDSRGWILQRLAFAPRYRVITFDNRGVGRSDKPLGPYDLERMALDAVEVLDAAGVDSAHVMGASMGGIIAQILAVREPARIRSLVLACTACRHTGWRRWLLEQWVNEASEHGMRAWAQRNLRWIIGPRSMRRFWPAFNALSGVFISAPAHAFVAQVNAILDIDEGLRDEVPDDAPPTLVICGSQDILTPQSDSEELAELIPGADLVVIRGASHGFMIEAAPAFNSAVGEFLGRVVRERHAAEAQAMPTAAG